jgi:hypothetical protein
MQAERYDGTMVSWGGKNTCYCTQCKEVFNSVSAFDLHIRGPIDDRIHDFSWMPLNSKGYRVGSLKET